ncbi:MAG: PilZ domain-containing protein [Nitrospira sp.]|nr:PilZ domain-containing protein [Nitrospira sp.]
MAVEPKSHSSKSKAAGFVLRPYRRIPAQRVLYYLSGECVGKGCLTNLSQSGMRIQGEHAVKPGLDMALRFTLADGGPIIEIEQAIVRWVVDRDFGVDFIRINPMAAKQIALALSQQIRMPQQPVKEAAS